MKDEQIARDAAKRLDPLLHEALMKSVKVVGRMYTDAEIDAIKATARRAGFDAAKEQAAEVADLLANEYDNDEPVEPWDSGANCAANEIAAAIRSMEPKP